MLVREEVLRITVTRTEKAGGTDASFPVLLAKVVTGTIKSARGAGGCCGDDAKNVACRVAFVHFRFCVKSRAPRLKYSTSILSVQTSFEQVIQLKDKLAGFRKERQESRDILQICP